jgi:hypothetical protein
MSRMKGKPWSADLPVVEIAQSDQPKPITLILPYYDNPDFLRQHLAWWATFPAFLRSHLSAIIVDDGSPKPAADVLRSVPHPFPIRHFRISVDVRWNWLAARNIGFHYAPEGWCAVTDIDHVIPESTATSLVYGHHEPGVIYGFSRREHSGETIAPHPNSWFLTREMFWTVGGYDERMSGYYGSDGDWRRRLAATAPMEILASRLIRHEYVGDSSTTRYLRKQPEDAAIKAIVAARGKGWKAKTLSFPYEEVMLETVCL